MATVVTTLAGQYITPIITPEQLNDFSVRYNIPYTQIQVVSSTTSGDVCTLNLGTTPTNWIVPGAYGWVAAGFTGTSVTSLAVTVGTTTNVACFLASTAVSGNATGNVLQATNGINTTNVAASSTGTTALQTIAQFTIQGAGFNSLTSGFLQLLIQYKDLTAIY
jgi:hypothetical protein